MTRVEISDKQIKEMRESVKTWYPDQKMVDEWSDACITRMHIGFSIEAIKEFVEKYRPPLQH